MKRFSRISTIIVSRKLEAKSKRKLVLAKRKYKAGDYSGHPEEMLYTIECIELDLAEIRTARFKGYTLNPKTVARYEDLMTLPNRSPAQLEFYEKQLKYAHQGLF